MTESPHSTEQLLDSLLQALLTKTTQTTFTSILNSIEIFALLYAKGELELDHTIIHHHHHHQESTLKKLCMQWLIKNLNDQENDDEIAEKISRCISNLAGRGGKKCTLLYIITIHHTA